MIDRRILLTGIAAVALTAAGAAQAHHGWAWAEDSNFELTGVIKSAKLGNPHGLLKVDAKGEDEMDRRGRPALAQRARRPEGLDAGQGR